MAQGATSDKNTWADRYGVTVSQCVYCKHWLGPKGCPAFPDGIPLVILANEFDHTRKYRDEQILFAPR